ncbi:hypothetical protein BT96DRAFT_1009848 [Gymnopus androsaceus JB14]|uniref:Uncharacterized protein n=1 Tax=Gymnopus androsaceus JB14 TaxID=1447944 RepID=A0A6A4GBW3_9AGAR|nr:hypothetical protein BT96DRAFT_1009848 [Gymnopus androsaceus JB14]
MWEALDNTSEEPWSILNFGMKVLKPEEKAKQDQEEWETLRETAEDNSWIKAKEDCHKAEKRKQEAKERQQKSRALQKQREIQAGECSPGGTKQKRMEVELTRPACQIRQKIHEKSQKPQGRPKTVVPQPATYTNWFTPFAWVAIKDAQVKLGGWSATEIRKILQRAHLSTFGLYPCIHD